MIPAQPAHGSTRSEADVFYLLQGVTLGADDCAFASLNLSEHEYKKWGEIDFVVLSDAGLLVIEVKGGVVSWDDRGIWRYESRDGRVVERRESPSAQSSSAYFALRDKHLVPAVGKQAFHRAPSGFCVIFAGMQARLIEPVARGAEMPRQIIGAMEDIRDPTTLARFLGRVLDYWASRPPGSCGEWSRAEVASMGRALRPCFDRVPPLSLSAARVRQEQLVLTEGQYAILDFSAQVPRLVCTGGAGCGKTLLAVECLRRELRNDPVLITGTPSLAPYLRATLPDLSPRIVAYQELSSRKSGMGPGHGCLIVDEGQQLTNRQCLDVLNELVIGGLENGRWRWFSDPNNQVLGNSAFDPESQRWLDEHAFRGTLAQNCRNTPQIASAVEILTGAEIGAAQMVGRGPEVQFATGDSEEARLDSAAAIVRGWLRDPEIRAGEIAVLSPRPAQQSSAWALARRVPVPAEVWHPGWDGARHYPRSMAVAQLEDFRGLEAPFVVLCDVDQEMAEPAKWVYLGLTRANFSVLLVGDPVVVARLASAGSASRNKQAVR